MASHLATDAHRPVLKFKALLDGHGQKSLHLEVFAKQQCLLAALLNLRENLKGLLQARRLGNVGVYVSNASRRRRSEEHTSELQSLMRISYAVFCLKKKNNKLKQQHTHDTTIVNKNQV